MRSWRGAAAAAAALGLLATSACGSAAATKPAAPAKAARAASKPAAAALAPKAAAPFPVSVQIPNFDVNYLPLQVAQQRGYYAKLGVAVHLKVMKVPVALAALLSHRIDFIGVGGAATQAAWKGAPIRLVASMVASPQDDVVVGPKIHTPQQLKGKSIASGASADTTAQLTAAALEHYGLKLSDVTFVGAGADPTRLGALEAGTVAAAVMEPGPAEQAVAKGMHILFDVGNVVHVPISGLATTTRFIRQHPAQVRAVIAGELHALSYIRAHPAAMTAVIAREFKLSPSLAKASYRAAVRSYNYSGRAKPAQLQGILRIGQAFARRSGAKGGGFPPIPAKFTAADVARVADFAFVPATPGGSA